MAWLLTLGTVPLQQLWQERWSTLSVRSDACSPPHQEHGAWPGACGKCSDITEAQAHERGVCQCPSGDDLEKESDTPLQQVSIEEILEEQRVEQQAKQESEKLKVQALKERGLSVPRADTLDEY
ncbi:U6 snRNA-associated Sm-like protein LSm1 isoform X2 [Accipiter gentilis]|uniref:U6 snRNA-associated Sm-like protein LSm1 isoform X2 n=1 Tax=Astur gentilis TaxID=8957 RepID=UPI00210F3325|nr:U6 snRNA-associated Sm-like protein LSm1 isoform X2 [Accipiter gentilis]